MQFQVTNSPFSQEQAETLNRVLPTLTESQKIWLSGYLSASQTSSPPTTSIENMPSGSVESTVQPVSKVVTILYGSQTGNAQGVSENAGKTLEARGFEVSVSSMNDFKHKNLKKVSNLLIVVSTHGEGDPPDSAMAFHEFLLGRRAPKLEGLRFSVLALGDTSYEFFCQTGIEFDQRLEELGGTRVYPRVDCDLDFEEPAEEWVNGVINGLGEVQEGSTSPTNEASPQINETVYSRTNPFHAEVLENINLNGRGSNKETRHLELSLEGSGLEYEPGDCLGVYPENDPLLVDMLIKEMTWDPDEKVEVNKKGETLPLREALLSHFEITVLSKLLLEKVTDFSKENALKELLSVGNEEKVKAYIPGRDLLDLVSDFGPWNASAQQFVSILRKMPARLYSISSSFAANPDEVHLTVGAVRYETFGRKRNGVCSILCSERLEPGDTLPVYIQHNQNFELPEKSEPPIIMVGPGTGIAPFRSFMQEREEIDAVGKSWLFFGEQHFMTDFLYQIEWQKWLKDGVLTKMDVAFSRDTDKKIYVQHRIREHSKELFEWLQQGAVLYVCGDKKNMAHDVHNALIDMIEKEGNMKREDAEAYLADMQKQKRYQRDVY